MSTRNLLAVACLFLISCDVESHGLPNADESVTLEITLNADGTMTHTDNGVTAALDAGNPVRVLARGEDGNVVYDVTGGDMDELARELQRVSEGVSLPSGDEIKAAFKEGIESMSPAELKATQDVLEAIPSSEELMAMSPEERAEARAAFDAARARAMAEVLRGSK